MLHRITAAIVFVIFSAVSAQAMTVEFRFLGQPYRWKEPDRAPLGSKQDWPALIRHEEAAGRSIALALADIAKRYPLDDFGRLMLLRELALAVPLDPTAGPMAFHDAWHRGWSATSRAVFVAAQLNLQGVRAVVMLSGGVPLVGLPVNEPNLNARTESITAERRLFQISKAIERKYALWDVVGRIGAPGDISNDADLLTPLEELFRNDAGRPLDFRKRNVPEILWARKQTGIFQWPGGKAVVYGIFPDVAAYVQRFPEHSFTAQLAIERYDMRRVALGAQLLNFADAGERVFVSQMLQAVQMNFVYKGGSLRSIHEILVSGEGDCDQLSLVLALLLLDVGYQPEALAAVMWQDADHLGLALRAQKDLGSMAGAAFYSFEGRPFYVLDPTFYHKRETELISSWGEMNPENVKRKATLFRLSEVL